MGKNILDTNNFCCLILSLSLNSGLCKKKSPGWFMVAAALTFNVLIEAVKTHSSLFFPQSERTLMSLWTVKVWAFPIVLGLSCLHEPRNRLLPMVIPVALQKILFWVFIYSLLHKLSHNQGNLPPKRDRVN